MPKRKHGPADSYSGEGTGGQDSGASALHDTEPDADIAMHNSIAELRLGKQRIETPVVFPESISRLWLPR
ncbi:hypothetical protein [Rhodococcoides fascians]|uniref:hypothetical protein n=1 Tax=Rhodococcoides fascians TaxID=1828 RepID=UPI0027881B0D|nr:hypothetical protein [Rhodococcus fascians]MDQ0281284.1 hypothetical protein [Rhodococcus fascians]